MISVHYSFRYNYNLLYFSGDVLGSPRGELRLPLLLHRFDGRFTGRRPPPSATLINAEGLGAPDLPESHLHQSRL